MSVYVPPDCPLTSRQLQILSLSAKGKTHAIIALELGIGRQAVKTTACTAYNRLNVANGIEAAAVLARNDWLDDAPPRVEQPLAVDKPFLAAYLRAFDEIGWPANPATPNQRYRMDLALAGHRATVAPDEVAA